MSTAVPEQLNLLAQRTAPSPDEATARLLAAVEELQCVRDSAVDDVRVHARARAAVRRLVVLAAGVGVDAVGLLEQHLDADLVGRLLADLPQRYRDRP